MDKMYADLWETDRIAKSKREEQEEKNLIERNRECLKVGASDYSSWFAISLSHSRYFPQFWGTATFSLRAYTLPDATFYNCSYLYTGNFTISTVKSRYSHCFHCLKLFCEDRQCPKNGRFWPS